jgi:hypothetical protein
VERCVHDGFSFVSFCIKNHRIKKNKKWNNCYIC